MTGMDKSPSGSALRQRAEASLGGKTALTPENLANLTPEAAQLIQHDLQVHQIELEMQNEQLRQSHHALDAARTRYFDLYDLAPVGYCSVSESGLIIEANLTAATLLGLARGALVKQRSPALSSRKNRTATTCVANISLTPASRRPANSV